MWKKTLCAIILSALGCSAGQVKTYRYYDDNYMYKFNEMIGKEQVQFIPERSSFYDEGNNLLRITRENGSVWEFGDSEQNDLKIEYIVITPAKGRKRYFIITDPETKHFVQAKQIEYETYLNKIKEIKGF